MEVTIGGNRLGSGKKMQARLNNYYRSTHNLSETFASSMGAGMLIPCMKKLCMRGDAFDIDINADIRTLPTQGPLFGSFKMQVDVLQCPVRLYQGILHNNPLAIGLKMNHVYFPTIEITNYDDGSENAGKFNDNCLIKYLGLSGIGRVNGAAENKYDPDLTTAKRSFNAIPILAYYDIYKTYYANKQEEKGVMIVGDSSNVNAKITTIFAINGSQKKTDEEGAGIDFGISSNKYYQFEIEGTDLTNESITITFNGISQTTQAVANIEDDKLYTLKEVSEKRLQTNKNNLCTYRYENNKMYIDFDLQFAGIAQANANPTIIFESGKATVTNGIKLEDFELKHIDDMRYELLCNNQLGNRFEITENGSHGNYLPYAAITKTHAIQTNYDTSRSPYQTDNKFPLNGICIKTYQNDIYNNWLNTEWIEGENGINELSKVQTDANGAFSMDALLFAQKLFNMLNRIAVAGATYEDWQDTMYEEVKRKQIESPIYLGGLSKEVIFDEIVQTAPAGGDPLGTLGGRGRAGNQQKGGKIHVKCDEACYIIAIVSLTPRIMYSQGNDFDMTDIFTMDDIHKPSMDGIGFQDLIGERLAWWDTLITLPTQGTPGGIARSKIGKLPAWIEYMTSVDKSYGDFAGERGYGYMVLNRNYEHDPETGGILDATTYIDPRKYNYVFAVDELEAQNFWCEIHFGIKARRLMSARLIPHV